MEDQKSDQNEKRDAQASQKQGSSLFSFNFLDDDFQGPFSQDPKASYHQKLDDAFNIGDNNTGKKASNQNEDSSSGFNMSGGPPGYNKIKTIYNCHKSDPSTESGPTNGSESGSLPPTYHIKIENYFQNQTINKFINVENLNMAHQLLIKQTNQINHNNMNIVFINHNPF